MKQRIGFVSNSSSSSFVVDDIQDYDGLDYVADMLDEVRQTGEKATLTIDKENKRIDIETAPRNTMG